MWLVQPLSASHPLTSGVPSCFLFAYPTPLLSLKIYRFMAWPIMVCPILHHDLCQVALLTKSFSTAGFQIPTGPAWSSAEDLCLEGGGDKWITELWGLGGSSQGRELWEQATHTISLKTASYYPRTVWELLYMSDRIRFSFMLQKTHTNRGLNP